MKPPVPIFLNIFHETLTVFTPNNFLLISLFKTFLDIQFSGRWVPLKLLNNRDDALFTANELIC